MSHKYGVAILLVLGLCCAAGAKTIYVDASAAGSNNGTSWANAYVNLYSPGPFPGAAGDIIKIAGGKYRVSATSSWASLIPNDNVTVEGGYIYTDGEELRNVSQLTVISADVNLNDIPMPDLWVAAPEDPCILANDFKSGSRNDNGHYVFYIYGRSGVTIDGLTLRDAYNGYGLFVGGSSDNITIKNVTISGCCSQSNGGAMMITGNSTATVEDCLFTQNSCAAGWGGVARIEGPDTIATVRNCIFFRNTHVDMQCVGLCIGDFTNVTAYLYDCVFNQNYGGHALSMRAYPEDTISEGLGYMEAYNCVVTNNINDRWPGAGIWLHGSDDLAHNYTNMVSILKNCLVANNYSPNYGAGILCTRSQTASLINCTVVNNQGPYGSGQGVRVYRQYANCTMHFTEKNCIIWGNNGPDNSLNPSEIASLSVTYNCIDDSDGSSSNYTIGTDNITTDPQFADSSYHLSSGSPCIDTGDPADDTADEPKCHGDRINMGAYGGTVEGTPTASHNDDRDSDIDCDGDQDLADFSALADKWLAP